MTTKAEIESVAIRAGCNGADLHLHCTYPECGCKTTPGMIKAAIAALDAHRLERGLKTVPREPTREMIDCGDTVSENAGDVWEPSDGIDISGPHCGREVWIAMWDAAPAAPEE